MGKTKLESLSIGFAADPGQDGTSCNPAKIFGINRGNPHQAHCVKNGKGATTRKAFSRLSFEYSRSVHERFHLGGTVEVCFLRSPFELGGVLVGRVAKSRRRQFLEIKNFVPATKGISRRASFEFTNEAQQEIHQVVQERFQNLRILGWFHTHPGYGIFLSSADQFIDQNYFNEPFHIAIVIDPTKSDVELGVFVWDPNHVRIRVPLFCFLSSWRTIHRKPRAGRLHHMDWLQQ